MLLINNLSKSYDGYNVFQGLTHTFTPGCYALCEEDSTGKSTLLAVIAGVVQADTGEVVVDGYSLGKNASEAKVRVAYVPDDCLQLPTMTGRSLLQKTADERGVEVDESVLELAEKLGLKPHLDKQFEQMSKGTRRKVYLCAAAIGEPCVVAADGPTIGLDTPAVTALAEQFKAWAQNRVVLFASHDPDFVKACEAQSINVDELR